jgi:hypothetical protein
MHKVREKGSIERKERKEKHGNILGLAVTQ